MINKLNEWDLQSSFIILRVKGPYSASETGVFLHVCVSYLPKLYLDCSLSNP